MTVAQMEKYRESQNIRAGHEWDKYEGLAQDAAELDAFLARVPFNQDGRRLTAPVVEVPSNSRSSRRRRCRPSRALASC